MYSASLILHRNTSSLPSHAGSCLITAFPWTATRLRLYSYAVTNLNGDHNWNVTVTDVTGRNYVFNASQPAAGRASSVAQQVDNMALPVTVRVLVEFNNYPDLVWIGFQGELAKV